MITRETAIVLENELTFAKCVTRQYDDQFAKSGAKIGNVLNVRLPVRFTESAGQGLILQDLTESSVPVVLNIQYQRSFAITSADLALDVDDFRKRFVNKAAISMANQIDRTGLLLANQVYNQVGTPAVANTTVANFLSAGVKLDNNGAPMVDRSLVLGSQQQADIIGGLTGLFNPQVTISKQFRKGRMTTDTLGFDWYMDQNVLTHTVGPLGGSPVVNGLLQTGSSIITNAWTSAAAKRLNLGDIVTFSNTYGVNPQSLQSTGQLMQFVVTADTSSDGAGNLTIPISPAIVTTGPYQNVTIAPTTNDTVVVAGAANAVGAVGLGFCEEAFTFASADLPLYGGLDMSDRIADDQDLKFSMRVIRDYDINMDRAPLRIDLLGGWAAIYPQLAVRIAS